MLNFCDTDNRGIRKIDLQLFAEGETPLADPVGQATDTLPTQEGQSESDVLGRIFDEAVTGNIQESNNQEAGQQTTNTEIPAQNNEPAQPEPESLILGKFKTVEDAFKGYKNLESDYTKKTQALSEVQKSFEALKSENERILQQIQQQPQQQPQQIVQQPQQPKDEFEGLDNEELTAKFYENPRKFMESIEERAFKKAEKILEEKLAAIESKVNPVYEKVEAREKQEAWDNAIREFNQNTPDMGNFKDGIKQYILKNNLHSSDNPAKVLEDAYYYAKGLSYKEPVDPKSFLSDENFLKENILNNPQIKDAILKQYIAEINNSNKQIPNSITGTSPANAPTVPKTSPTTIEEANKRAAEMFGWT